MFHRLEDNLDIPTHTRRAIGSPNNETSNKRNFSPKATEKPDYVYVVTYLHTSLEVVAVSHSAALDILWSGSSSFHIGSS